MTILFYSVSLRSADLTCIFNQSLLIGIYPFDWRLVEVSPILKNVSKTDPISVITAVSKIVEFYYDQLYNYPNVKVNLLTSFSASLAFALYTIRSLSCWRVATTGVSMLTKKAFDTIDQKWLSLTQRIVCNDATSRKQSPFQW